MTLVLALLALVLAAIALGVSLTARREQQTRSSTQGLEGVPEDLLGLRQEVAALRAEARDGLKHLAVVRYDAFDDMGGHLSWSLALLDDGGHGVVLTSIHGRSDARAYAKNIAAWSCDQQLSPEEEEAISHARS